MNSVITSALLFLLSSYASATEPSFTACVADCTRGAGDDADILKCMQNCPSKSVSNTHLRGASFVTPNESDTVDDDKKSNSDKPFLGKEDEKDDQPRSLCIKQCSESGLGGIDLINCFNRCNKSNALLKEETDGNELIDGNEKVKGNPDVSRILCRNRCLQQGIGILDCLNGCDKISTLFLSSNESSTKDDGKKPGSYTPKSDKPKNDQPTGGKPNDKGDIPTLLCQQRCTQQGLQGNDLLNCLNNCNKDNTSSLSSDEYGTNVKESNPFSEHCKVDCAEQGLKGRELASCQHNCDKSLADSELVDVAAEEESEDVPEPFESQCEYDCYVFQTTRDGLNNCLKECYYPTEEESENVPEPFESQCEYDCYVFQTTKDGLNNCLKKCYYPAEEKSENVPEPFEIQ